MEHFYRYTSPGSKGVCWDSLGASCVYISAVAFGGGDRVRFPACLREHIAFPRRSQCVRLNVMEWVCVFTPACMGECVKERGNGCV